MVFDCARAVRVAALRAVATLQRGALRYWCHVSMLEADKGQQDMTRGIMARHGAGLLKPAAVWPPCVAVGGTLRLVTPLQRVCGEALRPDGGCRRNVPRLGVLRRVTGGYRVPTAARRVCLFVSVPRPRCTL